VKEIQLNQNYSAKPFENIHSQSNFVNFLTISCNLVGRAAAKTPRKGGSGQTAAGEACPLGEEKSGCRKSRP
jgi:hypothetical protein